MMNPKKIAVAMLAAPALLVAVPAMAGADTGYRDCTSSVSEHAGADGADRTLGHHCTESSTGYGYHHRRGLLGGLLGGVL
ncbi:MAG: hypothetical protein ACRDP6_46315 [Actinoallomurus sp.]